MSDLTTPYRRGVLRACCLALLVVLAATLPDAAHPSAAATRADITVDTTWTRANSPYLITTTVTVAQQATLTVEPGVEARFSPGAALIVAGGLAMRGSQSQPISLVGVATQGWLGVELRRPNADVLLQSVTISGAATGVRIQQAGGSGTPKANATIVDSLVSANTIGIAIDNTVADGAPKVSLRNSLFTGNGTGLLVTQAQQSKIKFDHNSFVGNGLGAQAVSGSLKLKHQWWGSELGPLDAPGCVALALGRLDLRDAVCGLDPKDYKGWTVVPAGRVLLPAGQATKLESAVGTGVSADDPDAPTSVLTLTVATATFTQPVDLSVSRRALAELPGGLAEATTEIGFEITAIAGAQAVHSFANDTALEVDITYLLADLAGVDPATLGVVAYDEARGIWSRAGIRTRVDLASQRITARVDHLTRFSVRSVEGYSDVALPLVTR